MPSYIKACRNSSEVMRQLIHYPLCPFSRTIRILLKEKDLSFDAVIEPYWERRRGFIAMNPAGTLPVLKDSDVGVFSDSIAIAEYIDESYCDRQYVGRNPQQRAENRRLIQWFSQKFYHEVTHYILEEKLLKHYKNLGAPDAQVLRAAKQNIKYHLDYITYLAQARNWLGGEQFGLADIVAASQLSVLDYMGDVPWDQYKSAKEWYALIKSRPSFRPLLQDRIAGFMPPSYYSNPDF